MTETIQTAPVVMTHEMANDLRQRILRKEKIDPATLRAAVEFLRQDRAAAKPRKGATKAKGDPVDLDNLF